MSKTETDSEDLECDRSLSDDETEIDYGAKGLLVQEALIRHVTRFPDSTKGPISILWNGMRLQTFVWLKVPVSGRFRLEFLTEPTERRQGIDVSCNEGGSILADGEVVSLLRTIHEPHLESTLEYDYQSESGHLGIGNCYEIEWPDGRREMEKFTGNAAFILERPSDSSFILRCNPGGGGEPDFDSLVVRFDLIEPETQITLCGPPPRKKRKRSRGSKGKPKPN